MSKRTVTASHKLHYVVRFAYMVDVSKSIAVKNVLVQALTAAGFNVRPVATRRRDYRSDYIDNPNAPINLRAVTTCSPFPTGGSVLVPEFHTTDVDGKGFDQNYTAFSNTKIDDSMAAATRSPLARQGGLWNHLDRDIQRTFFPTVVTGYHGVALMRGSRVQGFAVDDTLGMPTWNTLILR